MIAAPLEEAEFELSTQFATVIVQLDRLLLFPPKAIAPPSEAWFEVIVQSVAETNE
jgi:hypothetical protein